MRPMLVLLLAMLAGCSCHTRFDEAAIKWASVGESLGSRVCPVGKIGRIAAISSRQPRELLSSRYDLSRYTDHPLMRELPKAQRAMIADEVETLVWVQPDWTGEDWVPEEARRATRATIVDLQSKKRIARRVWEEEPSPAELAAWVNGAFVSACPNEEKPVCDFGGRTHANACVAGCEAESPIFHEGPCRSKEGDECSDDSECGPDQYCRFHPLSGEHRCTLVGLCVEGVDCRNMPGRPKECPDGWWVCHQLRCVPHCPR